MRSNNKENKNQKEINRLFSETHEKLDKLDDMENEHIKSIVIKCIQRIKDRVPKERIPSIIVKALDNELVTEPLVHECMLKMDEKGMGGT